MLASQEAIRRRRLQEMEEVVAAEEGGVTSDEEDADEDDSSRCIVCMTNKRNACLVHGTTSHQVTCLPCANRLLEAKMGCPICKRRIDVVVENFTS